MENNPFVSICMITFNHERFITAAIEGVLNQDTIFDFELVLVNDCSSDKTDQFILNIININPRGEKIRYFRQKENLGANASFCFAFRMCAGKYIAICEGDDFWTDPYKLQKQVDFMEANPNYGMVHTDADVMFQNTGVIKKRYNYNSGWRIPDDEIYELLLRGIFIKTLTVLIRKNEIEKYYKEIKCNHWTVGDLPLFLYISKHSKVKYFNYSTGVYRILKESITHPVSLKKRAEFLKGLYNIELFFAEKFNCSSETKEYIIKNYNERKIEIGFYDLDNQVAKEGLDVLKKTKKLTIKYFLIYMGSKNIYLQKLIFSLMQIKKFNRIVIGKN